MHSGARLSQHILNEHMHEFQTETLPKRSDEELIQGVKEWVEKKFRRSDKKTVMKKLWSGNWSSELVVNVVKADKELKLIAGHKIKIHHLEDIIADLKKDRKKNNKDFVIHSACGADLVDLIHMELHNQIG